MKNIKSFIYLDEYKMYSFSSQVFEGLTEYILHSKGNKEEETSEQKGPLGSGRVMADIITTHHSQTERRYMHDYAYTLFESKLHETEKILEININNIHTIPEKIHKAGFVKIKGRASFQDTKGIHELISNFKQLSYSLKYVSEGGDAIKQSKDQLKSQVGTIADRNKKSLAKDIIAKKIETELKKFDSGLSDEFLFNLEFTIKELYKDQLTFQILIEDNGINKLFSAPLNRDYLKESITMLMHKYSRETEKEFTLFGFITQSGSVTSDLLSFIEKEKDSSSATNMKKTLMTVVNTMTGIDKTATGILENEFIIDPIAIYYEL